jgi:hypothetical protein
MCQKRKNEHGSEPRHWIEVRFVSREFAARRCAATAFDLSLSKEEVAVGTFHHVCKESVGLVRRLPPRMWFGFSSQFSAMTGKL